MAFPFGAIPEGLLIPRDSICAPEGGYRLAVFAPRLSSLISVPAFIVFPSGVINGRINPVPDATFVAILILAVSGVAVPCVDPEPDNPVTRDFDRIPP